MHEIPDRLKLTVLDGFATDLVDQTAPFHTCETPSPSAPPESAALPTATHSVAEAHDTAVLPLVLSAIGFRVHVVPLRLYERLVSGPPYGKYPGAVKDPVPMHDVDDGHDKARRLVSDDPVEGSSWIAHSVPFQCSATGSAASSNGTSWAQPSASHDVADVQTSPSIL